MTLGDSVHLVVKHIKHTSCGYSSHISSTEQWTHHHHQIKHLVKTYMSLFIWVWGRCEHLLKIHLKVGLCVGSHLIALCVFFFGEVSIGTFTEMFTSALIFFSYIISDEQYLKRIFDQFFWCCLLDNVKIGDELNVQSNSWSWIFGMAQNILDKYLIISNIYFTMKDCTDKEAILDFSFANIPT